MNTTFKAFVASTAAKVAAEICTQFTTSKDVGLLKDDDTVEEITIAAVNVAVNLANKLDEWWSCQGDPSTVMFDPQDSLTSNIERSLNGIGASLDEITEELKKGL